MDVIESVIKPLRPKGPGWVQWWVGGEIAIAAAAIERWYNRGQEVQVLSAVEVIRPLRAEARPEYHLSVSGIKYLAPAPYRCSSSRARWAIRQFGFDGYEEDNHVPSGKVRNFWRPVADPLAGEECECKQTEPLILEDLGDYEWRHAATHNK